VPPLLAVPNVSEGRDEERIDALERAFSTGVTLLDRHSDPDHNRTVFTLAGGPEALTGALAKGAAEAIRSLDMTGYEGAHPAVGALDVCPIVWIEAGDRAQARAAAVEVADLIADLGVPVFLYGELAAGPERVERAFFRNGGLTELWLRMEAGELRPDRGPSQPHRTAGATLVSARPPLGAFNIELDSGDLDLGRAVAAGLRESGGGLAGVRAIGLPLSSGRVQVSTNIQDLAAAPLGAVVERIRTLAAPLGARPIEAELVGLVPIAALAGYPDDVPIRDFDPALQTIERRLGLSS
jgi:glutamate formiminotransferase / 5-formyltetrahydrofolate cyclo-ligase